MMHKAKQIRKSQSIVIVNIMVFDVHPFPLAAPNNNRRRIYIHTYIQYTIYYYRCIYIYIYIVFSK